MLEGEREGQSVVTRVEMRQKETGICALSLLTPVSGMELEPGGKLVARRGFEPLISWLRTRHPGPLDERAIPLKPVIAAKTNSAADCFSRGPAQNGSHSVSLRVQDRGYHTTTPR